MADLMSQRAYARHRGVTHRAVQKAVADGRIKLVDGKIDAAQADRDWKRNTDESKPLNSVSGNPKHRKVSAGAPQAPVGGRQEASESPASGSQGAGGSGPDFATSRAIREAYLARLARLEYETKSGQLVKIDEVKVAWFKVISEAKTNLLAVPTKAKAQIPHLKPEEISILQDLIREALEETANCPVPASN